MIRKMKIYPRLIVSFVIIIVTASTVISGFNAENYVSKVKLNYYKNMEYSNNISATLIQSILKRYEQLGNSIFDDNGIMGFLELAERKAPLIDDSGHGILYRRQYQSYRHNIGRRLFDIYKRDDYIRAMFFIVGDRQYGIFDAGFEAQGGSIRKVEEFIRTDSFKSVLNREAEPSWMELDRTYVDIYSDGNDQDTVLMLAMNDYNFNDELNGTLLICIDTEAITEMFSSYSYDGDGNVLFITDASTQIPLRKNGENETSPSDYTELNLIDETRDSIRERKISGIKSIVASTRILDTDMYAVTISDYSILLKGFETIKSSNYVMIAAIIILSLIIHYFITLSITVPLNKLKKAMDKTADDNFDSFYIDNSRDEISSIGFHFNELVKRIKVLIDEVYITELHQKELNFRKKNAELNALQAQINPHFIYNTLDIIRWQAVREVGTESKANQMIIDFSNMLRIGTAKSNDIVPVMQEIEHVKAYVKLVNYKYIKNPINFDLDLNFDAENQFLTKLTLQPIVENCVLHGFENNIEDKRIRICGEVKEGKIHISVEDNGVGMTNEILGTIRTYVNSGNSNDPSIGLRNVCERLRLFYEEESRLVIESSLNEGTKVTVVVPYNNLH